MHPEIYRDLISLHGREMREQARRATLGRMALRLRRASRRGHGVTAEPDGFVVPAIPDYVDGSFRTEPAGNQMASEASPVPAARHAS
jgi:hypothetical protein